MTQRQTKIIIPDKQEKMPLVFTTPDWRKINGFFVVVVFRFPTLTLQIE